MTRTITRVLSVNDVGKILGDHAIAERGIEVAPGKRPLVSLLLVFGKDATDQAELKQVRVDVVIDSPNESWRGE